jgi:uncharacterized protein (DUF924 family)
MDYQTITDFWFDAAAAQQWWRRDDEFDRQIGQRFGTVHAQASRCELYFWRTAALGRLAEIIVLDQFSRHIYRTTAQAYAFDSLALALAQEAVAAGVAKTLDATRKAFLYMPFMHSESLTMHEIAVELFSETGLASNLQFEYRHQAIIARFGRYPHRNAVLGRPSTSEEIAFLKTEGSSF